MEQDEKPGQILLFDRVEKIYGPRKILDGITLGVAKGETVLVLGTPASGKTSLLRLALVEETPSAGVVTVLGSRSPGMRNRDISNVRKKIGTLHQEPKLLGDRSILENVMLPLVVEKKKPQQARAVAIQALTQVGLAKMENKLPNELSYSEKKRAAVGRAIARSPELLLLDEPFSGLGKSECESLAGLLKRMTAGGSGVLATCEPGGFVPLEGARVFKLDGGKLYELTAPGNLVRGNGQSAG